MNNLPILCLDFDGVIHKYDSPWAGPDKILDGVTEGFFDWLEEAVSYFTIVVYSSRSSDLKGIAAMEAWLIREWLAEHRVGLPPFVEFAHIKPMAFLQIDDRALTFEGDWNEFPPVQLRKFKPWNKRK